MSLLGDWLAKLRGDATDKAGKAAAGAAAAAATAAVSKAAGSIAEDFLSFAEGELDEAREARGLAEGQEAPAVVPGSNPPADAAAEPAAPPPAPVSARERREAAEAKARDELARLKAEMGKD